MSLDKGQEGRGPQRIDSESGMKRVGDANPKGGYSERTRQDDTRIRGDSMSGLDTLYGRGAERFVFDGETYDLVGSDHIGQITGNFLTASHLMPRTIEILDFEQEKWQRSGLYNQRPDKSNKFLLMGIGFLDRSPTTKESGLSIKRALASQVSDIVKIPSSFSSLEILLDMQSRNELAESAKRGLVRSLTDTWGVAKSEAQSPKRKGFLGLLGVHEAKPLPSEKYDTNIYPDIIGVETRLYYSKGPNTQSLNLHPSKSKSLIILTGNDLVVK